MRDAKSKPPLLGDPAVRQALSMLVDRASVQEHIYGRTGVATANSSTIRALQVEEHQWEFNGDKASQLLEAAGWKRGPTASAPRTARR